MASKSQVSLDGTVLQAGNGGSLVTSNGVWTFGSGTASTGSYILLNGKIVGPVGVLLKVANGGKLYLQNAAGQWYEYSGSQWLAWVDPALEATRSPDGTLLKPGSSGGLVTGDGVWTLMAGNAKTGAGSYILLNGKVVGSTLATELEVANGGKLYSLNAQGQWFQWTGTKWSAAADPNSIATLSTTSTVISTAAAAMASSSHGTTALTMVLVSDTGSSSADGITSNVAVRGTAAPGAVITIEEGSAILGTVTADSTGAWSFKLAGLADGAHTLTATPADGHGHSADATLSFTLDTTAPTVSMALVSDTGSSSADGITSNPAITGIGQANTLVTIRSGGTVLGTTMADSTGAWSFTPTGLANGSYTLTASQTDLAGNTGTAMLSLTLDKTAPVVSMALVSDTGSSSTDKITANPAITGIAQANTLITIMEGGTVLGTTTANGAGVWSVTPSGLADGAHILTVMQADLAGNTGTAPLNFTLDTAAPTVSMALASGTGSSSSNGIIASAVLRGAGQANTPVTIKEGSTVLGTVTADGTGAWSFTPTGLANGAHTLTAAQTDVAGNTGMATLSFTLGTTAPASTTTGTSTTVPVVKPPPVPAAGAISFLLQSGDGITALRLQNTGAATEKSGYVTFGQAFETGALMPGDSLVARIDGVDYAVQMDVKATNSDGSVRDAVLTLKAPEIAPGGAATVTLMKGSAADLSAAPSASNLAASGYDTTVAFTFHNADGTTTTDSASAKAALQDAINAGTAKHWLSGPEVNEYDVVTTVDGGKLKVEFDIRAYADGTTTTDVIFDNSWMFSPGKSNLAYDVAISQGGQQVYSASNVSQYLYSLWHHQVDSAGRINPNVQYDVSYLTGAAALPAYDQSYGASAARIQNDDSKLNPSISAGYGSTGPMGSAEVLPGMPTAGGRPDLATQPNWTAEWLLSQNSSAEAVMMADADASGSVPWHFTDENTGTWITNANYPLFFQDPRNVKGSGWSPQPANGWPSYGTNGDPWLPDRAHMPDLNYVPYLITGSHYQLELLQAAADYDITAHSPYYAYDADVVNPTHPGNAIFMGVASPGNQERAIAWGLRDVAEAAYATPDGDPLKSYFSSQLNGAMDGLVKYYITDNRMAQYGDLQGFLLGGEADASGNPIVSPWQEGYIVTSLAEIAGMNLGPASDDAVKMLDYMTNFVAGLYTNGENGYAPTNGTAYWLYLKDPVSKTAYSTWSDFSTGNVADYKLNGGGWGLPSANPATFGPNNTADTQGGYAIVAKAALADLITYTKSPQAIEAYGYVVGQIAKAWGVNTAGLAAAYQNNAMWDVMPRLPDGNYLPASQIHVDTTNNPMVTLTASGGDSLLAVVGNGTATLTGGSGGTDLLFGGSGPTTLIAGTGNDYLFAGSGATNFIDNTGDDYMKAGPAADTFTFADANSGHDTIVGFKTGTDFLKIAANLPGTAGKSAADLTAAADVVNGSTVLHLGPNDDITIRGIDTPSNLTSSIVLF